MRDRTILIRNVYYMLAYALRALHQREYADLAAEEFANVHDLFAAILSKGLSRQLKQGLYREYVTESGELPVLRGKLDVMGTASARMARRQLVSCEFDEFSEDNEVNCIIRSACITLARHGRVDERRRMELMAHVRTLARIGDVDLREAHWGSVRLNRANRSYRLMLGVCELLARGLLQSESDGSMRLADYLGDEQMCRLYERFVLEYYRQEHSELSVSAAQVPWALDDGCDGMLPVMQTDITLRRGQHTLIIDAKFYAHNTQGHFGVHTVHSANLYQIFTYVKNEQARLGHSHEVSGMLLYACTDEGAQPGGSYRMSGSRIGVRTLDLNRDFSEIVAQLDELAERYLVEEVGDSLGSHRS